MEVGEGGLGAQASKCRADTAHSGGGNAGSPANPVPDWKGASLDPDARALESASASGPFSATRRAREGADRQLEAASDARGDG